MKMKFKRAVPAFLAVVMIFSMSVASAFAADDPYSDPYYPGFDWADVDTSMCIPYTEYHAYPQPATSVLLRAASERNVFSGWVYSVPKNNYPATSTQTIMTNLSFTGSETGCIRIAYTDCNNTAYPSINVSLYDKDQQVITDYVTISYGSDKSFYTDPGVSYNLYISNNGTDSCNARVQVFVS